MFAESTEKNLLFSTFLQFLHQSETPPDNYDISARRQFYGSIWKRFYFGMKEEGITGTTGGTIEGTGDIRRL